MRLPEIELDDRRFQDLVYEARRRISRSCPEWTEHNVSDPGITLIELFAWMTEMTIYRLNRVPDKLHVKLLELLGIRLDGPTAARTDIRFRLSAQRDEIVALDPIEVVFGLSVDRTEHRVGVGVTFNMGDAPVVARDRYSCSLRFPAREFRGGGGQEDG